MNLESKLVEKNNKVSQESTSNSESRKLNNNIVTVFFNSVKDQLLFPTKMHVTAQAPNHITG